eukprot:PhM_4_TR2086/c1_g1_i3/m.91368
MTSRSLENTFAPWFYENEFKLDGCETTAFVDFSAAFEWRRPHPRGHCHNFATLTALCPKPSTERVAPRRAWASCTRTTFNHEAAARNAQRKNSFLVFFNKVQKL